MCKEICLEWVRYKDNISHIMKLSYTTKHLVEFKIYVYVTPPRKVYITFIITKPEGKVNIHRVGGGVIIYESHASKETVNGQAHALGCRDSRASKKASSWKVMSCIKDKENTDPHPTKKLKLSLSFKNCNRFKAITDKKLDMMSKPQVPKNTEKSSWWAMTNQWLNNPQLMLANQGVNCSIVLWIFIWSQCSTTNPPILPVQSICYIC